MKLVMATADFTVEGRSFAGFPLLLDIDGWPVEPAHSFLWHAMITPGSIESKLTWEAYGPQAIRLLCILVGQRPDLE